MMTAEETYFRLTGCIINHKDIKLAMIVFAQLHVDAALKAAAENAKTKEDIAIFMEGTYVTQIVDKNTIINAYPSSNIK